MTDERRVAYVVAFSAPPVLELGEFLQLLHARDWDTYVILSPTAATWVDIEDLAEVSGHLVRAEPRRPQEPDPLPHAETMLVAPLTFNSLNKWAAGISDTLALGLLNEGLGLDLPITVAPCIKPVLRRHPAYRESIDRLASLGVRVLDPEVILGRSESGTVTLNWWAALPPGD